MKTQAQIVEKYFELAKERRQISEKYSKLHKENHNDPELSDLDSKACALTAQIKILEFVLN